MLTMKKVIAGIILPILIIELHQFDFMQRQDIRETDEKS